MVQWLLVLFGVVSVAWSQPGPRYGDKYGAHYDHYGDTGPDPRKAYDFNFQTETQGRREASNLNGDVRGRYHYLDDLGVQRTVDYIAGKETGFVVTNETPDPSPANEASYYRPSRPGAPYGTYAGTRGYLSSKLNLDGSYNFKHSSPHQSHSEIKDVNGRVQGEYSYYDKEGKLHYVQYEAGPGIGYRVVSTNDGQPTPTAGKPFAANNYGPNSFAPSRAGRSPENNGDEILESANSNYFGSTKLRDGTVKIHHHGQVDQTGHKENSDEAVQIAWNPVVKKITGVGDKIFKNAAEEYERAPGLDAVDYFMDDELAVSKIGEKSHKMENKDGRTASFVINVPDPLFASSDASFAGNLPLVPLSPQEQDAINNLREFNKNENIKPATQNDNGAVTASTSFLEDEKNSAASHHENQKWFYERSTDGESLVNKHDLRVLKNRVSSYTPRLAQVISLD